MKEFLKMKNYCQNKKFNKRPGGVKWKNLIELRVKRKWAKPDRELETYKINNCSDNRSCIERLPCVKLSTKHCTHSWTFTTQRDTGSWDPYFIGEETEARPWGMTCENHTASEGENWPQTQTWTPLLLCYIHRGFFSSGLVKRLGMVENYFHINIILQKLLLA